MSNVIAYYVKFAAVTFLLVMHSLYVSSFYHVPLTSFIERVSSHLTSFLYFFFFQLVIMSKKDGSFMEEVKTSLLEIPRWKLALVVGTPVVALGVGAYLLSRGGSGGSPGQDKPPDAEKGGAKPSKADRPVAEVTPTQQPPEKKAEVEDLRSPLEKAVAMKNKGNKLFKLGKFDAAIENYTKAIELCPAENSQELSTFFQNRAAAYENLKNYERIIEDCSRALELNGKYVKALTRRAKAYEQQKRLVDCLDDVSLACSLEPNPNSFCTLERILKQLGKEKAAETFGAGRDPILPSTHFIRTYFSAFSNDPVFNLAIEKYQGKTSDVAGEAGDAQLATPFEKALHSLANESYVDIIALCDEELEKTDTPHRAEALLLRATFLVLQGRGTQANRDLDELLALTTPVPDVGVRVTARVRRAGLWMQTNDTNAALEDFKRAIDLDAVNSDSYHHRGQVHLMMSNFGDAVADFDKCVKLCPTSAVAAVQSCYARYGKAVAEHDESGVNDAMKNFYAVVDKFPECAEGWGLLGQVLLDRQQFETADGMFKKALEVEKDNASMLVRNDFTILELGLHNFCLYFRFFYRFFPCPPHPIGSPRVVSFALEERHE